jgi:hypothetical protein
MKGGSSEGFVVRAPIYLELALRLAIPLATLGGDLIRAAKAEGVVLLG